MMCMVTVEADGHQQRARALLDTRSTLSFVSKHLVNRLKAECIPAFTEVISIKQTPAPKSKHRLEFSLHSIHDLNSTVKCSAAVVDTITSDLPDRKSLSWRRCPSCKDCNFHSENKSVVGSRTGYLISVCLEMRNYEPTRISLAGLYSVTVRLLFKWHEHMSASSRLLQMSIHRNLPSPCEHRTLDNFQDTYSRDEQGKLGRNLHPNSAAQGILLTRDYFKTSNLSIVRYNGQDSMRSSRSIRISTTRSQFLKKIVPK